MIQNELRNIDYYNNIINTIDIILIIQLAARCPAWYVSNMLTVIIIEVSCLYIYRERERLLKSNLVVVIQRRPTLNKQAVMQH